MSHRRELEIGRSVLGRPIEAVHFTPPSYARPRPPALLFGAIHGDEPVTQLMLERLADELIERPPGRDTDVIVRGAPVPDTGGRPARSSAWIRPVSPSNPRT